MIDHKKQSLDYIIDNKQIKTVFQPIVSLKNGSILGHEALSRITCDNEIKNPEMLFTLAEEYNRLCDLEFLCRTTALDTAYKFMVPPYNKKLFINVNPNIMHYETFKKGFTRNFLMQYNILPQNVVFEITERDVIKDMSSFISTIDHYKDQDFQIAIDDAGAGYSGLNLISEVNPNYIKLDMKLIRGVDSDRVKFALVKGMVEFSKVSNVSLIAEGIETFEELNTLVNLGVQYGQGYLIQKPNDKILEISCDFLTMLKNINLKKNNDTKNFISNTRIVNLCKSIDTVGPNEKILNIFEFFKKNSNCLGLSIVENEIPIGIITKEKLFLKLSGHYGFALYQNKKISSIMDRDFLSVDYKTPVNVVSSLAMSRENDSLYDFIVVTENNRNLGIVTIKDLLKKASEIEISAAKHQNPLSGLAGNLLIEQELSKHVTNNSKYSVAYLDIDNFKAYNDVYGFENGDLIIKLLADILKKYVPEEHFIGHIGGDDFVIVVNDHITKSNLMKIVELFEHEVIDYYNKCDIDNGYITTTNRHGITEKFPLMTLTCVVVNNQVQVFKNVFQLTELLAEEKKIAKSKLRITNNFSK